MSLKEAMVKAGLVTEKEARQAGHRERTERKQDRGDSAQREAQARAEEARRQQQAQRSRDLDLNRGRQAGQAERESQARGQQLLQAQIDAALREGRIESWSGPRTYWFQDGNRLEALQVSADAARSLQEGKAAIARTLDLRSPYTVMKAGAARRLAELAPERVVTLHAAEPGAD